MDTLKVCTIFMPPSRWWQGPISLQYMTETDRHERAGHEWGNMITQQGNRAETRFEVTDVTRGSGRGGSRYVELWFIYHVQGKDV